MTSPLDTPLAAPTAYEDRLGPRHRDHDGATGTAVAAVG